MNNHYLSGETSNRQIGVILRDSNGIAQVKSVTGNKILRILKKAGMLNIETVFTFYFYSSV